MTERPIYNILKAWSTLNINPQKCFKKQKNGIYIYNALYIATYKIIYVYICISLLYIYISLKYIYTDIITSICKFTIRNIYAD